MRAARGLGQGGDCGRGEAMRAKPKRKRYEWRALIRYSPSGRREFAIYDSRKEAERARVNGYCLVSIERREVSSWERVK